MGFFQRLFGKSREPEVRQTAEPVPNELDGWEPVPGFIPADKEDYELVSVIATAIAAGDYPDSQFKVTRIMQRNPEALTVSLIASSIAAGDYPDSQLTVKSIYTKTNV
ncbi:hypothetical protein AB6M97_05125 [Streptococcus hillyeri]|uniref:Uncharacterized protein n=1 Tax=Streptococcus hillyeri TaxID=2282420 RepID=A0A3L9E1T0_9STRE|nr:hypothetical protein [Streptococcus hillyeri]RLY05382.1 hypothetical protein EAF07_01410 [Streptococcus hillyeri]